MQRFFMGRVGGALATVLTLATWAVAAPAMADTTLTYAGASGRYVVAITGDAVRIDGNGDGWQLYRRADPAVLSVDPSQQTFTRLDRDSASQIRQQMDALRAQINDKIQQLPENKRMAARLAMAEQIPGLNSSRHTGLDKTGGHDTVAGYSCDIYQIVRDGQPANTVCIAGAKTLGLSGEGFATVKSLFALLQNILKGTGLEGIGLPYRNLSGMPIRFVDSVSGEQRTLVAVSHDKIPASRFTIPGNYVEQQPQRPGA